MRRVATHRMHRQEPASTGPTARGHHGVPERLALAAVTAMAVTVASVCALGVAAPAGAQPTDLALASQAERPAEFRFSVDGTTLTVDLEPYDATVGAIEIEISGAPRVGGDCTPVSGVGACNDTDGSLHMVALNPTGWTALERIASITFETPFDTSRAQLVTLRVTDLAGVDLDVVVDIPFESIVLPRNGVAEAAGESSEAPATAAASSDAASVSEAADPVGSSTLVILGVGLCMLAALLFVVLRIRR